MQCSAKTRNPLIKANEVLETLPNRYFGLIAPYGNLYRFHHALTTPTASLPHKSYSVENPFVMHGLVSRRGLVCVGASFSHSKHSMELHLFVHLIKRCNNQCLTHRIQFIEIN